jgi:phosphoribosylaminoimidazole (AIR) synthetase
MLSVLKCIVPLTVVLGMVVVVPADKADETIAHLQANGEQAWRLGEITPSKHIAKLRSFLLN